MTPAQERAQQRKSDAATLRFFGRIRRMITPAMLEKRIVLLTGPNASGKSVLAREVMDLDDSVRLWEHPETGLYPEAQRRWVRLFVSGGDFRNPARIDRHIIETHSPYILSALNNLMYAGAIVNRFPERREAVYAIVPALLCLDPAHVCGYWIQNGKRRSIISPRRELSLICAEELDTVSNHMGQELNKLLDIQYDRK